jgi:uncharacterized UBP type Zn finger protein
MIPAQNMTVDVPAISLNGSAPHCEHLDGLQDRRAPLVVCLTCGWVACSGDSPSKHARAHYEETDHPLAAGLEPGPRWRWCYVHQRLV